MIDLNLGELFVTFLVLLFSLTVHEMAHAWTADRLGDPTARMMGRVSLNPAVHVDPIGTILLPLVAFASGAPIIGWAKPVPVNPFNLRNARRDYVLVAAAGPASNIAVAVLASFVMRSAPAQTLAFGEMDVSTPLMVLVVLAFQLNLLLALFNLIPVPPLDGGNVLSGLLPETFADKFDSVFRPYGFLVLYGLMLTGVLGYMIGPPYIFLSRLLRP